VPVIALAGTSHRARVGVSLLSRLGEPGWIGQTPDEYLAIACSLARDPAHLAAKRQAQRQKMAQSLLTDEKAYALAVEGAYQQMVETALRNQDAESAAVAATSTKSAKAQALEEKIRALPYWYHKIELTDGVVTPGWAPLSPDAYGIPDRLDGLRVLDIGAWDGFWSFEAMKRGAREVVAIDDFSDFLGGLNERDRRAWENFDLCREALGYSPDQCQRIEMSVYDIAPEKLGTFDVVFFFGTLYHLRHPLLALDQIASVATGELFVETAILDLASGYRGVGRGYANGDVVAEFYPGKEYGNNDTNWYTPTLRCLGAWMEAAGFEDIEGWLLNDRALSLATARGFAKGRRIAP
jgi:tRNA (mo5U34)-methyltransferase